MTILACGVGEGGAEHIRRTRNDRFAPPHAHPRRTRTSLFAPGRERISSSKQGECDASGRSQYDTNGCERPVATPCTSFGMPINPEDLACESGQPFPNHVFVFSCLVRPQIPPTNVHHVHQMSIKCSSKCSSLNSSVFLEPQCSSQTSSYFVRNMFITCFFLEIEQTCPKQRFIGRSVKEMCIETPVSVATPEYEDCRSPRRQPDAPTGFRRQLKPP